MYRKIHCDWFLSDGILPPVRLDSPMCVEEALVASGRIKNDLSYTEHMGAEWIYRRAWRYYTEFRLDGTNERVFLRLSGINGRMTAYLNGAEVACGSESSCEFEITPLVSSVNRLEIRFYIPNCDVLRPTFGFSGMLSFRSTGKAAITRVNLGSEGQICAALDLTSPCECEIKFFLRNSLGENNVALVQNLDAGYTPLLADGLKEYIRLGEVNTITVSVSADGSESDIAALTCFMGTGEVEPRGFIGESEEIITLGEIAGANCAFTKDAEPGASMRLISSRHGLEALSCEDMDIYTPVSALKPIDALLTAAGGRENLEKNEMWLLSGSDKSCYERCKMRVPSGDLNNIISYSRYRQARKLRAACLEARLNGQSFIINGATDAFQAPASSALIDQSGHMRPAYYALMGAWQSEYAFAKQVKSDESDGIISLEVFCVSDSEVPDADAVCAEVFDIRGNRRAINSFPAVSAGCAGRFTLELPPEGCAIVRLSLVKGEESAIISDEIVLSRDKTFEDIPITQLLASDGKVTNMGDTAALGVCVPGAAYFGCLLPGEYVNAKHGDPDEAEGLNIYM